MRNIHFIPQGLSTLQETILIQDKAKKKGVDWKKQEDVWGKVKEEMAEPMVEIEKQDEDKMEDEFDDFLFSLLMQPDYMESMPTRQ